MRQVYRLPRGGRICRDKPVLFRFNGRAYTGYEGDTLASALLANGVSCVARSWKYHRPRGIVGAGAEEPNAIVQLNEGAQTVPNARATQVEIYDSLSARSVSGWPSVDFDLMALSGLAARLLPAGFYYKTFMWPQRWWKYYEHFIRKAAGLGRAPSKRDPDRYEKLNAHCDVLVAGGGPAGLSAALAAARSGARVIIADEQSELGGSLHSGAARRTIDGVAAAEWLRRTLAELAGFADVRVLARSTVFGYHDHNFLTIAERLTDHLPDGSRCGARERVWRVRANQVVLATGACERPLVFGNNDRPGVMLASAVSTYVHRYAVCPGRRAVVFTNNDSAYWSALDLLDAGAQVAAIVDARAEPQSDAVAAARERGVRIVGGAVILDVRGGRHVEAAMVARLNSDGTAVTGVAQSISCDLIAVSGGWSPIVHLYAQSGGKPLYDEQIAAFLPGKPVQSQRSAGACNGIFDLSSCLRDGYEAGLLAARDAGCNTVHMAAAPQATHNTMQALRPLWCVPSPRGVGRGPKQFVDLQNDVAASDIYLAVREGFHSVEHVKRYTAMGFGTDQGKLGNINGLAILSQALGQDIAATGTTTFRPNYTPVTFGAIAGRDLGDLFDPVRITALHAWHVAHGARFENVGQWKRPWYYPRAGESMHESVMRECRAARTAVAVMDASTLGKIDIRGPDAAEFLNRVYTNDWHTLKVGRCRYGLMLREDGMVMDDGVTSRLGENHFVMTTTTGGAAKVYAWLERWLQTEWPELKVYLTLVTDHWATIAVVGPHSRDVLAAVSERIEYAPTSFPFMHFREGRVAGVQARVARISFSGELAYEVNIPANAARHVWEAIMAAGEPQGITPYGTETMHVLRAEKGYIIIGQDTDGSVTPQDLGMEWIVSKSKDFIGRRSFVRPDTSRSDRKQLVGLLSTDPQLVLPEGGQIVDSASPSLPQPTTGQVTSSYFSPALNRSIALALLKRGRERIGETVHVTLGDGRYAPAVISATVFYDPEGQRQHG